MKKVHANKAEPAEGGGKKEGIPAAYWATAVVVLVVLAGLMFYIGKGMPAQQAAQPNAPIVPASPTPVVQQERSAGAKAFLALLGKVSSFPETYEMVFDENVSGIMNEVGLMSFGANKSAVLKTQYDTRRIFWVEGGIIACEKIEGKDELCAGVSGNGSIAAFAAQVERTFVNREGATADLQRDNRLVDLGVLTFPAAPLQENMAGRDCTRITYQLDYSHLTLKQMQELGVNPGDPVISAFKNFKVTECLDAELGSPLSIDVSYQYLGQPISFSRKVTKITTPLPGNVKLPQTLSPEAALAKEFGEAELAVSIYAGCGALAGQEADLCFRQQAVQNNAPQYCDKSLNSTVKYQCYHIIAAVNGKPELCKNAGNLADDCYASVAAVTKNSAYCGMIANKTINADCVNATKTA